MNIVFLDIDGVMNNSDSWGLPLEEQVLNEKCKLLKHLVTQTNCKIVLSSTWRFLPRHFSIIENVFKKYDLEVFSCTPRLDEGCRGDEIKAWLKTHNDVSRFVILDDDADMCELTDTNLVRTDYNVGLTQEHINRAVEILIQEGEKL